PLRAERRMVIMRTNTPRPNDVSCGERRQRLDIGRPSAARRTRLRVAPERHFTTNAFRCLASANWLMTQRVAIVLAAGKGTRMKSDLPKVLVPACGRPLVDYVLDALERTGFTRVLVVVGYRADDVRKALSNRANVEFVEQREQLGTGHAVQMCRDALAGHDGPVLILTGDSPMVQDASLAGLMDGYERQRPACL